LERFDARVMTEDLVAKLEPYVKADGFNEVRACPRRGTDKLL
jgi:hypothetical protein